MMKKFNVLKDVKTDDSLKNAETNHMEISEQSMNPKHKVETMTKYL